MIGSGWLLFVIIVVSLVAMGAILNYALRQKRESVRRPASDRKKSEDAG